MVWSNINISIKGFYVKIPTSKSLKYTDAQSWTIFFWVKNNILSRHSLGCMNWITWGGSWSLKRKRKKKKKKKKKKNWIIDSVRPINFERIEFRRPANSSIFSKSQKLLFEQYYYFHNLAVDEKEKATHHAYDNGASTKCYFSLNLIMFLLRINSPLVVHTSERKKRFYTN